MAHLSRTSADCAEIGKEFQLTFVPFQDMFDSLARQVDSAYLVWDGVHPTMVGHEFMTRRWLETVE
ncbi:MAG: SGNH/GDSL hydrolase family protein [Clostridia bacterium]